MATDGVIAQHAARGMQQNASPKKEGVSPISADFAPKIGCHCNVLGRTRNQYQIEHLVKIGLVVSEISFV